MAKYVSGELHANGETVAFSTPEDAKALRANFHGANWFTTSDGTTEYGVSGVSSTFVKLTIDTSPLDFTKPNCDNYNDCLTASDTTETDGSASEE